MATALKVLVTALAGIVAFWLSSALLFPVTPSQPSWPLALFLLVLRFAIAIFAGRLVWRRFYPPFNAPGMWKSIVVGALLTGGIGFVAGFVGPVILAPQANQGPLLGIFITGPLGLILGGIGGAIRHRSRHKGDDT